MVVVRNINSLYVIDDTLAVSKSSYKR